MKLKQIDGDFCVCKVKDYSLVDLSQRFCFIGKTEGENSLVCLKGQVPANATACEEGWRAFCIEGELDFSLVGVLADISGILAARHIAIFAISTYSTDYILTKAADYGQALAALQEAGYADAATESAAARTGGELSVRQCSSLATDIARLKYISELTFKETFDDTNKPEDMAKYCREHFSEAQLEREIRTEGSRFYLAQIDGETAAYMKVNCGSAQTERDYPGSLEIQRLYVAKKYKGRHVGSELVAQAEAIARSMRAAYIWLGVWEHNDAAIRFYTAKGFERFGKHDFVLGTDRQTDNLMKKLLQ